MDQEGKVIHRLFGKWHEGLYCGVPPSAKCIWRPGGHLFLTCVNTQLLTTSVTGHCKERKLFLNVFLDDLFLFARLYAHGLWAVLWLYQVCHWTEWALPWTKRRITAYRCPIQARSKVELHLLADMLLKKHLSFVMHILILSSDLLNVFTELWFCWHRHLEEGNLEMASSEKQRIEDMQRTRRKWNEENNIKHEPLFFK